MLTILTANPEALSTNAIAAILGAISLVITAFGFPELMKNWKQIRELKYSKIQNELNETQDQLKQVKKELFETRDQLKALSTIISIVLPMIKTRTKNDKEILEMIRIFEEKTGINLSPTGTVK